MEPTPASAALTEQFNDRQLAELNPATYEIASIHGSAQKLSLL